MQHDLTPEQIEELNRRFDNPIITNMRTLTDVQKELGVNSMLNLELIKKAYNSPSDVKELKAIAHEISMLAIYFDYAIMPVGSPALMWLLTYEIVTPVLFAHSERISQDVVQDDGSVKKISTFKHVEFIELSPY